MEKIYHICNKSIAGYKIFDEEGYQRMMSMLRYYQLSGPKISFSQLAHLPEEMQINNISNLQGVNDKIVEIITFSIMPTHIHLLVCELKDNGIPKFVNDLLNSYTRYFNLRHGRKGPLWEGPSTKVIIVNDEHLLHESRYIDLNPVTAYLVDDPADWKYSSFNEHITPTSQVQKICNFASYIYLTPVQYYEFVKDGIKYQRRMAAAKQNHFNRVG